MGEGLSLFVAWGKASEPDDVRTCTEIDQICCEFRRINLAVSTKAMMRIDIFYAKKRCSKIICKLQTWEWSLSVTEISSVKQQKIRLGRSTIYKSVLMMGY